MTLVPEINGECCDKHFDILYLFTKILEVNLFAFAYRLFQEDFRALLLYELLH